MSTWTSERLAPPRVVAALCLAFALAGCMEGGGGLSLGPAPDTTATVARGAITVQGPRGFCVDKRATRDTDDGGFVLLADCAAVSRRADAPRPRYPALLTATVAPAEFQAEAQIAALERFFQSPEGRAALARDGNPGSIDLVDSARKGEMLILHAHDRSAEALPGLERDQWRAIFALEDHIVSASVSALEARPLSPDSGRALLIDFAGAITDATETAKATAGN